MLANVGIERAVISSLCQYGKNALLEIEDVVNPKSFTIITNQALYICIKNLLENNNSVDQALLLITIKDMGYLALFDNKKDLEYIGSLFSLPIKLSSVRNLAIRLEKLTIARTAIDKHKEAIETLEKITGSEKIEEIISISENPIFDLILELSRNSDSGPHLLFENIEEIIEELKTNENNSIGIPTPWKFYNAAIGGGLRRGGVNLLGSRTKIGKTTLAKEAILHFTNNLKIPALMLDTEMVAKDQVIRSLASISEIPMQELETGKFKTNHLYNQYVENAGKKLKTNNKFWYASIYGKAFEEILAIIRRWIVKDVRYDDLGNVNNCVVVYDYFKLMDRSQLDNLQEYQAMGFQISRLTDFAKEFDFPCLAFVQLNRQNDVSQSDRLRWLCHSFSIFQKKEPQETMDDGMQAGNRKLSILDTRFGPGLNEGDYICMNIAGDINRATEINLRSKLKETDSDTFNEI